MAKHSRLVTFAFNSKHSHNKTIDSVLAFFTNRCLTNEQRYTAVTSLDFAFFAERFYIATLLKTSSKIAAFLHTWFEIYSFFSNFIL